MNKTKAKQDLSSSFLVRRLCYPQVSCSRFEMLKLPPSVSNQVALIHLTQNPKTFSEYEFDYNKIIGRLLRWHTSNCYLGKLENVEPHC